MRLCALLRVLRMEWIYPSTPGIPSAVPPQVVCYQGQIREKPQDAAEAAAFLRSYGASSARTVGAVPAPPVPRPHRRCRANIEIIPT